MDPTVVAAVIGGVVAVVGGGLTYRSARQANRLAGVELSQRIYEKTIDRLEQELKEERDENAQLREQMRTLRGQVDRLTDTMPDLRAEVRRATGELQRVTDELQRLKLAILAPDITIDGLRDLVRRGT